jgi:hypothetical protein
VRTGFSVHEELELFRGAGLSALDVLRCGTVHAARFLGHETEWGTVAEGMRADLVLSDADPLADLSTLRHPRAVVCNGNLLDRVALDRLLDQRAAAMREPQPVAGQGGGRMESRQGNLVVTRGTVKRRSRRSGRMEVLERQAISQMGLSIDRSSEIVLDRHHTVMTASVTDETAVGQSTFQAERINGGYRLVRKDLDGWEESAVIASPPLHPSNRLSPAAFTFALQAMTTSSPGRMLDMPVAGPLEEANAPIHLDANPDGVGLVVRRHGERSTVAVSQPIHRMSRIVEDRFHGRFTTTIASGTQAEES